MTLTVFELNQFIAAHEEITTGSTIQNVIDILQEGRDFECPECSGTGGIAGPEQEGEEETMITCPLCGGIGKTSVEYEAVCIETSYIPVPVVPEEPEDEPEE